MAVSIVVCNDDAVYTDRLLSQLRRYRGEQTSPPMVLMVETPSTTLNLLELKHRHPLCKIVAPGTSVWRDNYFTQMQQLFSHALQAYQTEDMFLWLASTTYLIKPPRVQLVYGTKWGGALSYYEKAETVHSNAKPYPVPHFGYIVMERTFMERALVMMEQQGKDFDFYYWRNSRVFDSGDNPTIPLNPQEAWAGWVAWIAYELQENMDRSMTNRLHICNYLTDKSFDTYAQLGNLRNL